MQNLLPVYLGLSAFAGIHAFHHNVPRAEENTGPFKTFYQWNQLDFQYPTPALRDAAIASGTFIPENNLPLGVDAWGDRLFVTMPRWKPGVPATLAWLPNPAQESSPAMMPYPDWSWHSGTDDCSRLISVFRMSVDECGRMWVLDAGIIDATVLPNPVCPPKLIVFDLNTDQELFRYEIPKSQVKEDSLHSNIVVDIRNGQCDDAHAYLADVWRYGILVFSMKERRSWRTTSHLYTPDPLASDYTLHDVNFQWSDGVFGMSLAPLNKDNDRVLFYHPMSSFNEFEVSTTVLRNETVWLNGGTSGNSFRVLGYRGKSGHSSASAIDRDGVMFYNLVTRDSVGCWDLRKPYNLNTLGLVARNNETLIFPNDMKIDHAAEQGLWVLSNRLPIYLYAKLDSNEVNFRILRASTKEAVEGTVCDPLASYKGPLAPSPQSPHCG